MLGLGLGIPHGGFIDAASVISTGAPGLKLWLKNNTGVAVGKWNDSSGQNNHIVQSVDNNQAAISGGGLDFESTESDHYDLDTNGIASGTISVSDDDGFCIALVVSRESSATSTIVSGSQGRIQFGKDNPPHTSNSGVFRLVTQAPTTIISDFHFDTGTFGFPTPYLVMLNRSATVGGVASTSVFTFSKNGTKLIPDVDNSVNVAPGQNRNGFNINHVGAKDGLSNFFDGKILELAFWDRSLTNAEQADVNSYLTGIHGI